MQVDDQLKATVRHHLANWKTLRGNTPFYAKMFWPPVVEDTPAVEPRVSHFTEFPSFRVYVEEIFTSEQVQRAQEEFPQFSEVIGLLLGIEDRVRVRRRPERDNMGSPVVSGGKMTFDLVKKALQVEAETKKSLNDSWRPVEILKFALKAKNFAEVLYAPVEIITTHGEIFYYRPANRESDALFGPSLVRAGARVVNHVLAKHAIPLGCLNHPHDLSAFTADIASQGYDAVFVSDGAENSFIATGISAVKSIRAMDKHLGSNLPVRTMEWAKGSNRLPVHRVIRPLLKSEYGIRVFVAGGEVIAATAQSKDAIPGNQTEPFVDEVGHGLSDFATGVYKTHFDESIVESQVFARLIQKARVVAADLQQAGELHYAMDLLIHEDDSFAIDLCDLASADYFGLSPTVVATAIQKMVIADMTAGLTITEQFSGPALAKLAASLARNLTYTLIVQGAVESEGFYDYDIQSHTPKSRFSEVVENTARIRDLLSVSDTMRPQQAGADVAFLADWLAIPDDQRTDFDLVGFIEAIRLDFIARAPSDIQTLWNPEAILCLVPLLDAALWFKNGESQTWRYCASNQFGAVVTVRPIGSAPSRSEQGLGFSPAVRRRRIRQSESEIEDSFALPEFEDNENVIGHEFEMPPESDDPDEQRTEPTFDFLAELLEDED